MQEIVLITNDGIGGPDQKLGHVLMGNFLRLLGERAELPKHIVLLNGAVNLAISGSDTLDYLTALQEKGVKIDICRTCVEYYGVEDAIAVGEITTFVPILDLLSKHAVLTI